MRSLRRLMLGMLVAVIALGLGVNSAKAGFINGSFETGSLAGWGSTGSAFAATFDNIYNQPTSPTHGNWMAVMDADPNWGGNTPIATIDNLVGAGGALVALLPNATSGSAIWQTIHAVAGSSIQFDWNFQTTDYLPFNDSAFITVSPGFAGVVADVALVGAGGSSGWQSYSYTFNSTGFFRIGVGVVNMSDTLGPTGFYVDNFQAVPVPAGALLMGLGVIGLGAYRLRRRTTVVA